MQHIYNSIHCTFNINTKPHGSIQIVENIQQVDVLRAPSMLMEDGVRQRRADLIDRYEYGGPSPLRVCAADHAL